MDVVVVLVVVVFMVVVVFVVVGIGVMVLIASFPPSDEADEDEDKGPDIAGPAAAPDVPGADAGPVSPLESTYTERQNSSNYIKYLNLTFLPLNFLAYTFEKTILGFKAVRDLVPGGT